MESFPKWETLEHQINKNSKTKIHLQKDFKMNNMSETALPLFSNSHAQNNKNEILMNHSPKEISHQRIDLVDQLLKSSMTSGIEEKALEKLIIDDDPLNYILLVEMFEDEEFESLVKTNLTSQVNNHYQFQLKLLWADWLTQDQRFEQANKVLLDLLLFIDPQHDIVNYSKISLALGKIATNSWKLTEALNHFHNVLEIENKLDEKSILRNLDANRWIGVIKFYQALHDESLILLKKCLADATPILGSQHPWIFAVLLDISFVYEQKWSLNEAFRLGKEVLGYQKEFFKTSVYQMARSYELMGLVYFKQGNLYDSRKMFEKALKILHKFRDKKHIDCIRIYLHISSVYLTMSYIDKAFGILQKCQKILKNSEYKESVEMSQIYYNSGAACFYKRKFYDSVMNFTNSLNINTKLFGKNHPLVAYDYQMIGRILTIQGRCKEAFEMLQKGLDIIRNIFGINSFELGKFYQSLGLNYLFQGELLWSMKSYKKCLLIQERGLNKDHYFLAMPYTGMARVYFKWGQTENALLNYEKSLELWKFTFGNCHPKIASNYSDIGDCFTKMEFFDKSSESYMKALLSGYSAPTRHASFEKKTFQKQRDSKIYLNLMSSLNG